MGVIKMKMKFDFNKLINVAINVIIFLSFYFGIVMNIDGLINIGYFWIWLLTILYISILSLGKNKIAETYKHQSAIWRVYEVLTDILYVSIAAYFGWFVLASLFIFGAIFKIGMKIQLEDELVKKSCNKV